MGFKRFIGEKQIDELTPLDVHCTDSYCENGLHCFKKSREMSISDKGKCRSCGTDFVDWNRIYKKNLADCDYTFNMLKTELVRKVFWHTKIDQKAINHAMRKGVIQLRLDAEFRLWKSVANENNPREGIQTPKKNNIIYYAQCATACCCRNCMEYWHGIPKGIKLNQEQVAYFVELIMMYIKNRMPDLKELGVKVPYIRKK